MKLSQEAIELLRDNEVAWQIVYNTLQAGKPIRELGHVVGYENRRIPNYHSTFGFYDIPKDKLEKALSDTISTGILAKTVESDGTYYSIMDEKFSTDLSELLIYAKANSDTAEILHHYLGKRIAINGEDGVLAAYNGDILHIRYTKNEDIRIDNIGIVGPMSINNLGISNEADKSGLIYSWNCRYYLLAICSERKKEDIKQILKSANSF